MARQQRRRFGAAQLWAEWAAASARGQSAHERAMTMRALRDVLLTTRRGRCWLWGLTAPLAPVPGPVLQLYNWTVVRGSPIVYTGVLEADPEFHDRRTYLRLQQLQIEGKWAPGNDKSSFRVQLLRQLPIVR